VTIVSDSQISGWSLDRVGERGDSPGSGMIYISSQTAGNGRQMVRDA